MEQKTLNDIQKALMAAGYPVEAKGDCLTVSGDNGVDAYIALGAEQLVVSALLVRADRVQDRAALNEVILRSHQLVPLTSVGISTVGDTDYYVAFGALSTTSADAQIVEEVQVLLDNIPDLIEAFEPYLISR